MREYKKFFESKKIYEAQSEVDEALIELLNIKPYKPTGSLSKELFYVKPKMTYQDVVDVFKRVGLGFDGEKSFNDCYTIDNFYPENSNELKFVYYLYSVLNDYDSSEISGSIVWSDVVAKFNKERNQNFNVSDIDAIAEFCHDCLNDGADDPYDSGFYNYGYTFSFTKIYVELPAEDNSTYEFYLKLILTEDEMIVDSPMRDPIAYKLDEQEDLVRFKPDINLLEEHLKKIKDFILKQDKIENPEFYQ